MKHVDLSTEDFEFLRFMFRVKANQFLDGAEESAKFAQEAHREFDLGDDVVDMDSAVLAAWQKTAELIGRIDEALEVAQEG